MWSPMAEGLNFLINTLCTIYLFILMLRILLPVVNADYYNPVSQFVLKFTQPLMLPLQRLIPRIGHWDTAALLTLFVVAFLKNFIILSLLLHAKVHFFGLTLLVLVQLVELLSQLYFFTIIIQVIISWVQPQTFNPFITIIAQLTEPVLNAARRTIPTIAGLDISSMVVLLILQLMNIMLLTPLAFYALQLSVGVLR